MKKHLLTLTLFGLFLAWTGTTAQELVDRYDPSIATQIPNEWESVSSLYAALSKPAQGPPLNLRNGAVPNGLQGFYDYQSNGMSPGWIRVNPDNPDEIHMVYMRADDGSVFENISPSRRVGYTVSTDGGKTWNPVSDVSGTNLRLGFPYLGLADIGSGVAPLIATHGDPNNVGVQTLFYSGTGSTFAKIFEMPRLTAGGRDGDAGAGAIWPSFATHGDDPFVQEVIASLSFREGENAAPLQVSSADFNESSAEWANLGDSILTAVSGGRYVISRSPSGKLGIAYHQFANFGAGNTSLLNFTESTDNGETWSTIEIIFNEETIEFENLNGDEDTLQLGTTLDFVYMGEDPHIVFERSINGLFRTERISHWSRSSNKITDIATTDLSVLRGIENHPRNTFQPGGAMSMSYPSISVGDDGKHIVVAFMSEGQTQNLELVVSDANFGYQRIWMVGSQDGGETWGDPRVLQDWAGDESDSASCEYPSLNEICRVDTESGNVTVDMAFQARRFPGMYAFIINDIDANTPGDQPADRGPLSETFQYFQRSDLTPAWFGSASSVDDLVELNNGLNITSVPNPAQGVVELQYSLEKSGTLSIDIFNTLGQKSTARFE